MPVGNHNAWSHTKRIPVPNISRFVDENRSVLTDAGGRNEIPSSPRKHRPQCTIARPDFVQ